MRAMMKRVWIVAAALAAAACQAPVEPVAEEKSDRLMRGCGEADRLLEQMKSAESSFQLDGEGNATIRRSLWSSLPDSMQDGLLKAIAYDAVCKAGEPREQVVTMRSSESSEVLAQQTITEFAR
ncbi:hypothetical protein [Sphingosinicella terrae]|uniref:hypothetical protein n=1 Tax=Sphingosinicella terrae TaxID=2172047 RepID=UPI0013B3F8C4|nr:hypothetical protein [Sphingosinicella terrae]